MTVWRPLFAVLATVLIAAGYGTWRIRTVPVRAVATVGLVQPNVGYDEKWEVPRQDSIVQELLVMSAGLRDSAPPDFIVWPEAAIPGDLQSRPTWDTAIPP